MFVDKDERLAEYKDSNRGKGLPTRSPKNSREGWYIDSCGFMALKTNPFGTLYRVTNRTNYSFPELNPKSGWEVVRWNRARDAWILVVGSDDGASFDFAVKAIEKEGGDNE